jgi:hypothetical protein
MITDVAGIAHDLMIGDEIIARMMPARLANVTAQLWQAQRPSS